MPIDLYPNIAKVKRNGVYQNLPGFVQQSPDADIEAMIANKETSTTAQYAHPNNSFFILNNVLYQADADINVNDIISVGTNCHATPLGNSMYELYQLFEEHNLEGKVVSILGDSISTYDGWIPVADGHNLTHRSRYINNTPWYTGDVDDTWWKKLIDRTKSKLGINDSWAGSKVSNSQANNSGDYGPDACMAGITRITNLGSNGTPDIIFFYGGTNDAGTNVTIGTFDSTATYTLDLSTNIWDNFATAYKDAIMRLQHYYPNAKIIVLLPTYTTNYYTLANLDKYNEVIKEICDYFGVDYLDLRRCGINYANVSTTLGDGVHPTVSGFSKMENYIEAKLSSLMYNDGIENIVYSVTNLLVNASNNNRYIKGVSAGGSYTATITGNKKQYVHVVMNNTDITSQCYNPTTGAINISQVTGNIVISNNASYTWYSDRMETPSDFTSAFNVNGYGWVEAYNHNAITGKPINVARFRSTSDSGTLQVGVVNNIDGTTITNVQNIEWDSSNKIGDIVEVEFEEAITLTGTEHIVIFPNTAPDATMYYCIGTIGPDVLGFYTRVPMARDSGTSWGRANDAELGIDFGYVIYS